MKPLNVKLSAIEGGFSCSGHYICHLCGKQVHSSEVFLDLWNKLIDEEFYCSFCLRYKYHIGHSHILLLSFRGIIAHYYSLYSYLGEISLSKIEDYIAEHEKIGLKNPLFTYDSDTYLWFVDFSLAADKVILKSIVATVTLILKGFQWAKYVPELDFHMFSNKFLEAIERFAETRSREIENRVLCPTFSGCLPSNYYHHNPDYSEAKLFLPSDLQLTD